MCYEVKCDKCGKRTWAGCGRHKDSVMVNIPENERCECPREESFFSFFNIFSYCTIM